MIGRKETNHLMHAIKFLFILLAPSLLKAQSIDEQWLIAQAQWNRTDHSIYMLEYVRRDYDQLLGHRPFLGLVRGSFGQALGQGWQYLLGAAYLNFAEQSNEFRLHQNLIHIQKIQSANTQIVQRLSLEQRKFESDQEWMMRLRYRIMANPLMHYPLGLSLYNEGFYVLKGGSRFPTGINENRLGVGIRYTPNTHTHLFLYKTDAYLQTLKTRLNFDWWQLQVLFQL